MDFQNTSILRCAFNKVEEQCPGFLEEFVCGILSQFKLDDHISEPELLLRLTILSDRSECIGDEQLSVIYNEAKKIKESIVEIPYTIDERPRFVESIRTTAFALKRFLEAVNRFPCLVEEHCDFKHELRELMLRFRKFSDQLKLFFMDDDKNAVFGTANLLVQEIDRIQELCVEK